MDPLGNPPIEDPNPDPDSLVWSMGHRNVQGLAWDSRGQLWATEFGQNTFDEVNLIEPGGNYGWPEVEGVGGDPAYVDPLVTWSTDQASPSGAAILADTMYVGALRGQRLWRIPLADGSAGEPELAAGRPVRPAAQRPGRPGRNAVDHHQQPRRPRSGRR